MCSPISGKSSGNINEFNHTIIPTKYDFKGEVDENDFALFSLASSFSTYAEGGTEEINVDISGSFEDTDDSIMKPDFDDENPPPDVTTDDAPVAVADPDTNNDLEFDALTALESTLGEGAVGGEGDGNEHNDNAQENHNVAEGSQPGDETDSTGGGGSGGSDVSASSGSVTVNEKDVKALEQHKLSEIPKELVRDVKVAFQKEGTRMKNLASSIKEQGIIRTVANDLKVGVMKEVNRAKSLGNEIKENKSIVKTIAKDLYGGAKNEMHKISVMTTSIPSSAKVNAEGKIKQQLEEKISEKLAQVDKAIDERKSQGITEGYKKLESQKENRMKEKDGLISDQKGLIAERKEVMEEKEQMLGENPDYQAILDREENKSTELEQAIENGESAERIEELRSELDEIRDERTEWENEHSDITTTEQYDSKIEELTQQIDQTEEQIQFKTEDLEEINRKMEYLEKNDSLGRLEQSKETLQTELESLKARDDSEVSHKDFNKVDEAINLKLFKEDGKDSQPHIKDDIIGGDLFLKAEFKEMIHEGKIDENTEFKELLNQAHEEGGMAYGNSDLLSAVAEFTKTGMDMKDLETSTETITAGMESAALLRDLKIMYGGTEGLKESSDDLSNIILQLNSDFKPARNVDMLES